MRITYNWWITPKICKTINKDGQWIEARSTQRQLIISLFLQIRWQSIEKHTTLSISPYTHIQSTLLIQCDTQHTTPLNPIPRLIIQGKHHRPLLWSRKTSCWGTMETTTILALGWREGLVAFVTNLLWLPLTGNKRKRGSRLQRYCPPLSTVAFSLPDLTNK